MSYVFHRDTRADMPIVVRGDGIWIEDATGKRYMDASGGAAVSCLGHSHERVIAAVREQVGRIAFAHTGAFSSEPAEALAEVLVKSAPGNMARDKIGRGPGRQRVGPAGSTSVGAGS